jgi:hypothetical protein
VEEARQYSAVTKVIEIDCSERSHQNDPACLQLRTTKAAETSAAEAKHSADLSEIAISMSTLAFLALLVTIFQGRSALRKSQRANEISEHVAQRQLRAYTVARDLGFEWKFVVPVGEKVCLVWVNLQNAGLTPTRDLKLIVGYATEIPEDIFDKTKFNDAIQSTPLGPGLFIRTPEIGIPLAVVEDAYKAKSKLFVFGAAHYQDVFQHQRVTRFCFEVRFSKSKDSELPDHINWSVEGSHNCADEECSFTEEKL